MKRNKQGKEAQQKRLLAALRASSKGLSTIQIREQLDIMAPAARVHELRWEHGQNIQTVERVDTNAQGFEHTCAYYVLLNGKWNREKKKKAS